MGVLVVVVAFVAPGALVGVATHDHIDGH